MRWLWAMLLGMGLTASLSGCRSCEHVENELRSREEDLRTAREGVSLGQQFVPKRATGMNTAIKPLHHQVIRAQTGNSVAGKVINRIEPGGHRFETAAERPK